MLSSGILKPGERGTISTRLSAPRSAGVVAKLVEVHSNDPRRPLVRLVLKALVKPPN